MYREWDYINDPIVKYLHNIIPHKDWFIAGGYLSNKYYYSDVNIYFLNESALKEAIEAFKSKYRPTDAWENIYTYLLSEETTPDLYSESQTDEKTTIVQLSGTQFGTPEEVISRFDLNKSQVALTSDYKIVTSENYDKPLHIIFENITMRSFIRLAFYRKVKGYNVDYFKEVHDYIDYVTDHAYETIVPNFYRTTSEDNEAVTHIENLLEVVKETNDVHEYGVSYRKLNEMNKYLSNMLRNNFPEYLT